MSRTFTRRLVLERASRTGDGGGGHVRAWETVGALWAEVRMRSGSLRATEFGETPRMGVRITTHVVLDGDPMRPLVGDRLRDGPRIYAVGAVLEEGSRPRRLAILAAEVSDGGRR